MIEASLSFQPKVQVDPVVVVVVVGAAVVLGAELVA